MICLGEVGLIVAVYGPSNELIGLELFSPSRKRRSHRLLKRPKHPLVGTRFGTHGLEGIHMKLRSTRAVVLSLVLFPFAVTTAMASIAGSDSKRLAEAANVISSMRTGGDNGIPEDLWRKAECVLVFPNMKKAAFIVGGEHGKGVMSCRAGNGWSAPVFMDITKGSAGFQIGVESTDLVLLVMNREGAEKLLNNKVSLGADASVAAGPVGRTAAAGTDAQLTAQILSYSRSKGLFAGINLSGGAITPDKDANADAFGALTPSDVVLLGKAPVPVEAAGFVRALGGGARATTGTTTPSPAPSTGKSKSRQPAPKY